MKNILHVSHHSPDIDAIASMVWGKVVFGGDILIPDSKLLFSSEKVLKDFKIEYTKKVEKKYDYTFIYDLSFEEDIFIPTKKFIIFDHHSKKDDNFFRKAVKVFHKENSANVINLYELSQKWKVGLTKEMKFLFAIAIYSDTAMLKTARREQLLCLAKLMNNHTIEDIMEYACPHRFGNNFLINISKFHIKNEVLYGDVKNGDEFYGMVDGIFKVVNARVLCSVIRKSGTMKFYCDKKNYQWLIQKILKPFSKKYNVTYAHTNLYNFTDYDKIIEFIKNNGELN